MGGRLAMNSVVTSSAEVRLAVKGGAPIRFHVKSRDVSFLNVILSNRK